MTEKLIEMMQFHLLPEVDEAHFLEVTERTNQTLKLVPGFFGRELGVDRSTGQWTDIVYWRNVDAALSAQRVFQANPDMEQWSAMVDPEGIVLRHLDKVAEAA